MAVTAAGAIGESNLWKAIKANFGSVWGIMGIIVGAISMINIGVMYFDVGIGPVLERIVETYRSIVHTGFDYLFFWIEWQMPAWAKDAVTIYIVFGAASFRGHLLTQGESQFSLWHYPYKNLFLLWWLYAYRISKLTIKDLSSGNEEYSEEYQEAWEVAVERGQFDLGETLDEYMKGYKTRLRQAFWSFWISFISVPLAAFCFIVVESGL